jgi:hypothetical protein
METFFYIVLAFFAGYLVSNRVDLYLFDKTFSEKK